MNREFKLHIFRTPFISASAVAVWAVVESEISTTQHFVVELVRVTRVVHIYIIHRRTHANETATN